MNICILLGAGILGLIIGSFLNVVIYRLPIMLEQEWRNECLELLNKPQQKVMQIFNIAEPRSHCPACKSLIPIWYNIPIISYLLLKGKCHKCRAEISISYPLAELFSAILTVFIIYYFGLTTQGLALCLLSFALITLFVIDLKHQILPDNITLSFLWLGLFLNIFNIFTTPVNAILGAISGYLSLWLIAFIFKKIRKIEGMGHGDFKLLALFGAWFGWQAVPAVIILAALMGSIIGIILILAKKIAKTEAIPFGPYLALAGWIVIFWGKDLINWYLHFTGLL